MWADAGHVHAHPHRGPRRFDAPPISYVANIDPALQAGLTADQLQDVLVAIAPIVGTARVMTAAGNITEALGIAIAVADAEAQG